MTADYFESTHHGSFWRQRGSQPLLHARRVRHLRRHAVGRRLVDVGSGEGHFAAAASRGGFDVVALDYLVEGVRRSAARLPDGSVGRADATALPLRNGCLHVLTLWDVLEHLDDPERAIREAARALAVGGLLGWSTPNPRARSVVTKGDASTQFQDPTHVSIKPAESWTQLMSSAGLRQVSLGTDAYWDVPYPGARAPAWLTKVATQVRFATAYSTPRADGENLVGLHRKVAQ